MFKLKQHDNAIFVQRVMPDGQVAALAAAIPAMQSRSEMASSLWSARKSLRDFTEENWRPKR